MPRAPLTHEPRRIVRRPREQRPSANDRGYGSRWRRYRKQFLSQPQNALCRDCVRVGLLRPATDVDHIQPVTSRNDPRFWDPTNHQPLCHACHSRKTARENL
jgi:5-methylcytosine-specific restriction protein A